MKKRALILLLLAMTLMTGCHNYTATRNNEQERSEADAKAIKEEQDAIDNSPKLSKCGMELWDRLESEIGFKKTYDKRSDNITLRSDNMEITGGGQEIGVIYFTLYSEYPLDDLEIKGELLEVVKIISDHVGVSYNENAVIENIANVDRSKVRDSLNTDYAENIELYSCLWNDGIKECIDLRIVPKS